MRLFLLLPAILLAMAGGGPQEDLRTAIRRKRPVEAEEAIARGAKADAMALCAAVQATEVLKVLLKHARPIDLNSNAGELQATPLGCAVMGDHADALQLLVDAGADIEKPCAFGQTAFQIASNAITKKPKVLALLEKLRKGKKRKVEPDALYKAALAGDAALVKSLLTAGADVNGKTKRGGTALHAATQRGASGVVHMLLAAGADPNLRGPRGMTTLMYAAGSGDVVTLAMILNSGVDPDETDNNGSHPIDHSKGVDPINEALLSASPLLLSYEEVPLIEEDTQSDPVLKKVRGPCYKGGSHTGPEHCGQSGTSTMVYTNVFNGPALVGSFRPSKCIPLAVDPTDYVFQVMTTRYNWTWECLKGPRTTGDAGPAWVQERRVLRKQKATQTTRKIKYKNKKKAKTPAPTSTPATVAITAPAAGDQFAFNSRTPGTLTIPVVADVQPPRCQNKVTWTMRIGSSRIRSRPKTDNGDIVFEVLPRQNNAFGDVDITASACGQSDTITVQVFYAAEATNHPGKGSGQTPNWFYYWGQSRAGSRFTGKNAPLYKRDLLSKQGGVAKAQYDYTKDRVFLGPLLLHRGCDRRPNGMRATGIDCYAELLRHELYHRFERWRWWGPKDPTNLSLSERPLDHDRDLVPTHIEEGPLGVARGCNSGRLNPLNPRMSCQGRPFDDLIDVEMNAYTAAWTMWNPNLRLADAENWAVFVNSAGNCDGTSTGLDAQRSNWSSASPCPPSGW